MVSDRVQVPLTGESAGRQIWYRREEDPTRQRSKSGASTFFGDASQSQDKPALRPFLEAPVFCAAENPNSSDRVFRNLMIEAWTGDLPDHEYVPATAREVSYLSYPMVLP